jgi:hypothetical protein
MDRIKLRRSEDSYKEQSLMIRGDYTFLGISWPWLMQKGTEHENFVPVNIGTRKGKKGGMML